MSSHTLLIIPIRRCDCLRDVRLRQDKVEPIEIRLIGVGWRVTVGVEWWTTTCTVKGDRSRERDGFSVLDVEVGLQSKELFKNRYEDVKSYTLLPQV